MKILFISMHSIHFIRWVENLKDTNHELFWFDILDGGNLDDLNNVTQFINWKKRKFPILKGEYTFSKKFPEIYFKIKFLFEITENQALEEIINKIKPDIIHSFEMQSCSYPILKTMNKFPKIKWIYSCWGSDLYYYKDFKSHNKKINNVLKRVNFLLTDSKRDYYLAKELSFEGRHLGVIPGGAGYVLDDFEKYKLDISDRKIILVKGYQHKFGRAINVIKALKLLDFDLNEFEVVVFGAHKKVCDYILENNINFNFYDRHQLSHKEVMILMGKSLLFIGNSISDGIPNTLLESIIMGAFPIQSNPGNVTKEIIDEDNGLLINDPESIDEIKSLILKVLNDKKKLINAQTINDEIAISKLNFKINKEKIVSIYESLN